MSEPGYEVESITEQDGDRTYQVSIWSLTDEVGETKPDWDGIAPGFRRVYDTGYEWELIGDPGPETDRLLEALNHWDCFGSYWFENRQLLQRWLRIFHGGRAYWWSNNYGGGVQVLTQVEWERWGNTGPIPEDCKEPNGYPWQQWMNEEVYCLTCELTIDVEGERHEVQLNDWEFEGPLGMYYGLDEAREVARERLEEFRDAHKDRALLPHTTTTITTRTGLAWEGKESWQAVTLHTETRTE